MMPSRTLPSCAPGLITCENIKHAAMLLTEAFCKSFRSSNRMRKGSPSYRILPACGVGWFPPDYHVTVDYFIEHHWHGFLIINLTGGVIRYKSFTTLQMKNLASFPETPSLSTRLPRVLDGTLLNPSQVRLLADFFQWLRQNQHACRTLSRSGPEPKPSMYFPAYAKNTPYSVLSRNSQLLSL
ncbi:uncharacterized protein EI97DRAFT_52434 [Westerdykella ornata]|uniref:Uncharacterized protein n=1 Tax=Westerdykella ornata TaxID=318751 RepID=A0A6A6JIZ2_WESOR|nr:uncharacterized protein EI97DRAFT_52434 [Westerdykella ornata]KAF2276205.1 hypothetical protein EI97DRAFT_52434 [Westerdykella ornata]